MTDTAGGTPPPTAMLEALAASGPHPEHASELMLFGQLVGSWDIEATLLDPDGGRRELRGEWHFAWVLEGRAIQDVLISPPLGEREGGERSFDYGTTLRFYDREADAWQITYVTPVGREVHHLIARQVGEEIVLEGTRPDCDLERWTFSQITADAFLWQGRISSDEGRT